MSEIKSDGGSFKFDCPHCAQSLEATMELCGQTLDCPTCQKTIVVPEESELSSITVSPGQQSRSVMPPPMPFPIVQSRSQAFLLTIGDIGISSDTVVTPNGTGPLAGSQWICMDMSRMERKMPTWAIVMAIILALFCLVGLFFLLVKEEVTQGYVEVSVRTGGIQHMVQIPVSSSAQVAQIRMQVNQIRQLAGERVV